MSRSPRTLGRTRAAAVTVLSLLLAGCWWQQPGAGPGNTRYVPFENRLTPDNVAGLTEQWSVDLHDPVHEPVTDGQRLYAGHATSDGTQIVTAIDIPTGNTAWQRPLPTAVTTGPMSVALSRGELWVSHVARFPVGNPLCADLTRLDPATGEVLGTEAVPLPTTVFVTAGPIVAHIDSARCSLGSLARLVVRDRDTLAVIWTASLGTSEIAVEPIIADGKIYAGDQVFSADGCGAAECAPLPIDTRVLMAAGGRTFAFANTNIQQPPPNPVLIDYGHLAVSDASTGQEQWRDDHGAELGPRGGVAAIVVDDETLFATTWLQEGPVDVERLSAYPIAGCGSALCEPTWTAPAAVRTGPLAVAGDVVYGTVRDTGTNDRLLAYDADGCGAAICEPLLDLPLSVHPDNFVVSAGHVFVMTTTGLGTPDVATRITAYGLP